MTSDEPEWKRAARAMKTAADETGCDFMTAPIRDIAATLQRAAEIEKGTDTPPGDK